MANLPFIDHYINLNTLYSFHLNIISPLKINPSNHCNPKVYQESTHKSIITLTTNQPKPKNQRRKCGQRRQRESNQSTITAKHLVTPPNHQPNCERKRIYIYIYIYIYVYINFFSNDDEHFNNNIEVMFICYYHGTHCWAWCALFLSWLCWIFAEITI